MKYHMGIEILAGARQEVISFDGNTIGELLERLITRHPALKACFAEKDKMEAAPGFSILLNGKEIMWLQGMSTPLSEGDEIDLLRFVSGG